MASIYTKFGNRETSIGLCIFLELLATAWIWVGWFLSLRISNGLDYDALWKRAGVTILTWTFPITLLTAPICGSVTAIYVFMWIWTRVESTERHVFWITFLAFALSAPLCWLTLHLNRRAEDAWKKKKSVEA